MIGDDDLYNILGVPKSATPNEISSAYRRLSRTYHPDRRLDADEKRAAGPHWQRQRWQSDGGSSESSDWIIHVASSSRSSSDWQQILSHIVKLRGAEEQPRSSGAARGSGSTFSDGRLIPRVAHAPPHFLQRFSRRLSVPKA